MLNQEHSRKTFTKWPKPSLQTLLEKSRYDGKEGTKNEPSDFP